MGECAAEVADLDAQQGCVGVRAGQRDHRVDRGERRDHDDRHLGLQRLELGQELQPRLRGQPQVEQRPSSLTAPDIYWLKLVGRLKPGVLLFNLLIAISRV